MDFIQVCFDWFPNFCVLDMDLGRLCSLLGVSDPDQLAAGFSSLLGLFPNSSCESIQLVNVLIPLTLDSIRPFFKENAMVQVNCYFYSEVSIL